MRISLFWCKGVVPWRIRITLLRSKQVILGRIGITLFRSKRIILGLIRITLLRSKQVILWRIGITLFWSKRVVLGRIGVILPRSKQIILWRKRIIFGALVRKETLARRKRFRCFLHTLCLGRRKWVVRTTGRPKQAICRGCVVLGCARLVRHTAKQCLHIALICAKQVIRILCRDLGVLYFGSLARFGRRAVHCRRRPKRILGLGRAKRIARDRSAKRVATAWRAKRIVCLLILLGFLRRVGCARPPKQLLGRVGRRRAGLQRRTRSPTHLGLDALGNVGDIFRVRRRGTCARPHPLRLWPARWSGRGPRRQGEFRPFRRGLLFKLLALCLLVSPELCELAHLPVSWLVPLSPPGPPWWSTRTPTWSHVLSIGEASSRHECEGWGDLRAWAARCGSRPAVRRFRPRHNARACGHLHSKHHARWPRPHRVSP